MEMRTIIKANDENLRKLVRENITKWGTNADLNHIDVSQVTDMSNLFTISSNSISFDLMTFKGNISQWDVSNIRNMRNMFKFGTFLMPNL